MEMFLSDEALAFDEWMRDKIAEDEKGEGCGFEVLKWTCTRELTRILQPTGLAISLFTSTYSRVKDLASDEAVVSHAVRRHAPSLAVSEDGKHIRRKDPFTLFDSADFNQRTIYIEGITGETDLSSLLSNVDHVLSPQILTAWNEKLGPGVTGKYPDLVLSKQARKRKLRKAGYSFVVFQTPADATNCLSSNLGHLRPIPFDTHRALTKEYKSHLATQHALLRAEMNARKGSSTGPKFVPGLVAEFSGAHAKTNRKILHRLFSRVAEVAYLDFNTPSTDGHGFIRFKTLAAAKKASAYFSGTRVVQTSADDSTGSLQDSLPQPMDSETVESGLSTFGMSSPPARPRPLRIRILEGREEEGYWVKIREAKEGRMRKDQVEAKEKEKRVEMDVDEEKRNHVRFDSSEEDESEEELEGKKKRGRAGSEDEEGGSPKRLRS
jgi:hypothetical protein